MKTKIISIHNQRMSSLEIAELTGKQHKNVMQAIRNMEPAWEKTCGLKFQLTSRTVIQPNGGTRDVPCYSLTKTECLYIATKFNDYYAKHGCDTIRKIVARWAPETENQVSAYINTVCKLTGWNADSHLPPMKKETKVVWFGIVLAMASVECGLNNEGRQALRPDLEKAWDMLYNPFIISC